MMRTLYKLETSSRKQHFLQWPFSKIIAFALERSRVFRYVKREKERRKNYRQGLAWFP